MSIVTSSRPVLSRPAASAAMRIAKPASLGSTIDPVRVLRRHVVAIAVSVFLGGVLGVASYFACIKLYPLYGGQVLFEVMPGLQQSTDLSTMDTTNDEMVFRIAQTESIMLRSRPVLEAALKNPDIRKTEWHKAYIENNSDGTQTFRDQEALDDLVKHVGTSVVRSSNLFALTWSAHDPGDVQKVLNAIERAYTENRTKRDVEVYNKNLKLFEDQLSGTERNLQDLGQVMKKLIRDQSLTSPDDSRYSKEMEKDRVLMMQRAQAMANYTAMLSAYQIASAKLEGTMEPSAADRMEAEKDMIVQDRRMVLSNLSMQLRKMHQDRKDDDPMVGQMERTYRAAQEETDAKRAEVIRRNLEGEVKQLAEDLERLRSVVDKQDEELDQNNAAMKDVAAAQSEYDTLRIQRDHLSERQKQEMQLIQEVKLLRLRADASRVRTAQPALEPRQLSFPKPEIMVPLGVLLALGLTVGVIFLRELLDQRVKSASDLAVLPGAYVLGGIPEADEDPTKTSAAELVVRKQPFSVLAESYRQTFTAMSSGIDRAGHQTLLLVGGLPGTGTTTVATNLAAAAAATGKKVLVIDANFRRPRLAQAMEVPGDGPGLGDLLSGAATLDEAIVDAGNGVSIIPAGTPANRVIERLNNGLFDSMVAELRGRFDLVIFDAPPAVVAGDAMVLANKVDAAILIVRAHQEHRGLVARMINQLSDARCELLGVVLNRPRGTAGGYFKKNYATMAQYASNGQA